MSRALPVRGFAFLEVVIAVALFAVAVAVILALLPGLARRSAENADRLVAQRLPDTVRVELARLAAADWEALADQVPLLGEPLVAGFALVAPRTGEAVQSRDYRPPVSALIEAEERYFLIECWRFPAGPLRYESGQSSLALAVRVSWPTGEVTPSREFLFTTSLQR